MALPAGEVNVFPDCIGQDRSGQEGCFRCGVWRCLGTGCAVELSSRGESAVIGIHTDPGEMRASRPGGGLHMANYARAVYVGRRSRWERRPVEERVADRRHYGLSQVVAVTAWIRNRRWRVSRRQGALVRVVTLCAAQVLGRVCRAFGKLTRVGSRKTYGEV